MWHILGIEPTKDKKLIKQAYADLLRTINPHNDIEQFKNLNEAFKSAMSWADTNQNDELPDQNFKDFEIEEASKKSETSTEDDWLLEIPDQDPINLTENVTKEQNYDDWEFLPANEQKNEEQTQLFVRSNNVQVNNKVNLLKIVILVGHWIYSCLTLYLLFFVASRVHPDLKIGLIFLIFWLIRTSVWMYNPKKVKATTKFPFGGLLFQIVYQLSWLTDISLLSMLLKSNNHLNNAMFMNVILLLIITFWGFFVGLFTDVFPGGMAAIILLFQLGAVLSSSGVALLISYVIAAYQMRQKKAKIGTYPNTGANMEMVVIIPVVTVFVIHTLFILFSR